MTNQQIYLAIALPTIAVLASLTVSLIQIFDIKGDIREIRTSLDAFKNETNKGFTGILVELAAIREHVGEKLVKP